MSLKLLRQVVIQFIIPFSESNSYSCCQLFMFLSATTGVLNHPEKWYTRPSQEFQKKYFFLFPEMKAGVESSSLPRTNNGGHTAGQVDNR